jgi:hypothetical protein
VIGKVIRPFAGLIPKFLCFKIEATNGAKFGLETTMNMKKFNLSVDRRVKSIFLTLGNRAMQKQRREERRFAEQRTTNHRFLARKSCIADAQSYRIARRPLFLKPVLAFETH